MERIMGNNLTGRSPHQATVSINEGLRPFVLIDKTVLLGDQPLNVDPARLRYAPGWSLAIERLNRAGFGFAVVGNEGGVALGLFDVHALEVVHRHLESRFASRGLELAGVLFCPHHPEGTVAAYAQACDCRIPAAGLFARAATELGAQLQRSWFIGDSVDDVTAARRAGCRVIVVDSGQESELVWQARPRSYQVAPDLCAAADLIMQEHYADVAA
ncbi:MAG: D-glycero-alpha-D-manno-heptose-1,7-bisphosphate 7-phosphatase [Gemmatimonadaceae bacterium]